MIKHVDLHQLTGSDQVAGHLDVGLAGRGVAAGMVVHEYQGRRTSDDCNSKCFTLDALKGYRVCQWKAVDGLSPADEC